MKKYGDAQELDVVRGQEAQVLHEHMNKLGKFKVSDFTEKQLENLREELDKLKEKEDSPEQE